MNREAAIIRAVEHALVAQGLMIWARLEPDAARGLLKAADHHRGRAARVVDELQGRATEGRQRAPLDRLPGLETVGGGQGSGG